MILYLQTFKRDDDDQKIIEPVVLYVDTSVEHEPLWYTYVVLPQPVKDEHAD